MSNERRSEEGEWKRDQGECCDNLPRAQCTELGAALFLDALLKSGVTQAPVKRSRRDRKCAEIDESYRSTGQDDQGSP